jgi:flagellar motor switch protein FliM
MASPATATEGPESLFAGPQDIVERLPMLRTVFEKAAAQWVTDIGKISATTPQITLEGVKSGPAEAMIEEVSGYAAACVLEATSWNGRLIVCADYDFVATIVEMLLGGDGSEPPAADRKLTRIDTRLVHQVFGQFAGSLEVAFDSVAATHFATGQVASEVNFDVLGRMTVPIVAAKFSLSVLGLRGEASLLLSQSLLSPMRAELSRVTPPEATMPDPAWSEKIHSEVTRTNVELVAVLDEQTLSLEDIARFSIGQMLQLRATPEGPVLVECNGERLINCQIGKANGVYTLRVHDFIDHNQEFMDDILAS